MNRPFSVAFLNNRLVILEQHKDCVELRTRGEFEGAIWKHTALVYDEGDVWFVILTSEHEDAVLKAKHTFEAEAFLTARNAIKHAVHRVATAQGHRQER